MRSTLIAACLLAALLSGAGRAQPAREAQSRFSAEARQGQNLLDAGHPGQALPHLEAALRLRPDDSPTRFSLGVAQLESGKAELAFQTLAGLAAKEPGELATRAYLIRAALRTKRPDAARANLATVRKLSPADGPLHAQLVEWLFQDEGGVMTREQIAYTLGLPLPPAQEARVHYLSGVLDQREKRTPRAIEEYARALKLDDSREEYFAALVNLQGSGKVESIDAGLLSRGLARFPESKDLQIADALRHMNAGRIPEAFAIAGRLQTSYPRAAEVQVLLGRLQLADQEYDRAAASLERALELRSSDPAARYYLGIAYRRQDKDTQAIEQFEKAVTLQPDYRDALLELGRTRFDLKQYEQAGRVFAEVIRVAPSLAVAYNLMAQTQQRLGKADEAGRYLARFKELSAR